MGEEPGILDSFIDCLKSNGVKYCVVGGQAVNAYVEPLVSLDMDVVVASEHLERLEILLGSLFSIERFPHSLNVSMPDSDLRIQIQTDSRYLQFLTRGTEREVLGMKLPVADIKDVLQGKIWAVTDSTRRPSKRQKDLADIGRLIEAFPELRDKVPQGVLDRLYE